jgi:segregation and condensation protein A
MVEKKIPWWRRALNFALGGIRSGFGLFSRSQKPEPVTEPAFSGNLKDNQEEEAVLSDPFPQPENADAAVAIPAEPEPTPAAEVEPSPEPVGVSEIAAELAPDAEPDSVSVSAIDEAIPIDPIPAEAEQAEAPSGISDEIGGQLSSGAKAHVDRAVLTARLKSCPDTSQRFSAACEATPLPAAEPDPEAKVVAEEVVAPAPAAEVPVAILTAEPEPVIAPEAENEAAAEPIEADEVVVEDEPEPAPEPIAEAISEQAPDCVEDSEPVAEEEVAETPEAEAENEAASGPIEADEVVEDEPEPAPEPIAKAISEQTPSCITDSEPVAEEEVAEAPEAETEDEIASEPAEAENVAAAEPIEADEAVMEAEREAAAEQAPDPAPVPDVAPPLVLTSQLMADEREAAKAEEKAAAKLAARQKRLDESSEQSPFSVIVGKVYDGPLDLLLDLIRKQDIDIYDIPIAKITAQFLAYVNQLKAGDVDVAGEFIYTASLLIHIKSRMLLPRAASGPEDEAEDPRRELVERLLEHERFKNAAQMLQQKQMLEAATWSNPGANEFKDDAGAEPEIAADTVDLVRIFRDILERARKRPAFNVQEDSVTVGQMIQFLARRLTMEDKPVALRRLLSHTRSERALIAMFLALLELVRLQAILLRQDRQFSEIFIKKNTDFDTVMNEGLSNARDDWR